jgi:small-conductance mechanosensitive channel
MRFGKSVTTFSDIHFRPLAFSFFLFLALITSLPASSFSDETPESLKLQRHLVLIAKKAIFLEKEIATLRKKSETKENLQKIIDLQTQIDRLNLNFDSMATNLSLEDSSRKKKEKSPWAKQLEEITMPLLQAIRDLTEKPRKVDSLKKRITDLENILAIHKEASQNLEKLATAQSNIRNSSLPEEKLYLSRLALLESKYDPELTELNLQEAKKDLEQILSSDESLLDTAKSQVKDFFKNRGKNLLITLAAFCGLWWLLNRLRKWVLRFNLFSQLSPSFGKLFSAAYNIFILIICLLVGMACLYFFNDWLLISLIVMVLILVAWTSRQYIPTFLQEIKLIVNLGTVREGERLIWNGVPWLVKDIGLNATLINENLEGGEIRLPVKDLINKHSRPVVEGEPWFPTKSRDWVILNDGSYGWVQHQTLEQVILNLKGGSLKFYSTADFLSQSPLNISTGFRYCIEFGLDYEVQSRICEEIPKLFEDGLKRVLNNYFEGPSPDFNFIEVRFDNPGSSALNLMVIIHVDGKCADRHEENRREIQTALVQISNENNLTIPFSQLTINMADGVQGTNLPGTDSSRKSD